MTADERVYSGELPHLVRHTLLPQSWRDLTYLHWPIAPDVVQRSLPPGLQVDTFEDQAWVGLVPFELRLEIPGYRRFPRIARFGETNVRTYVLDEFGRPGVWFYSLDATLLPAVVAARVSYGLPYLWSPTTIERGDGSIAYQTVRRWPGPRGAFADVAVDIGEQMAASDVTPLDHFLTARWRLFTYRRQLRSAEVSHEPWPLYQAHLRSLDENLIAASGLPTPEGTPRVLYSPRVDVAVTRPKKLHQSEA